MINTDNLNIVTMAAMEAYDVILFNVLSRDDYEDLYKDGRVGYDYGYDNIGLLRDYVTCKEDLEIVELARELHDRMIVDTERERNML